MPALRVRKIPRRKSTPYDADEIGRRVDGDRPHVQGGVPEGPARARDGPSRMERRHDTRRRPSRERVPWISAWCPETTDAGADLPGEARSPGRNHYRRSE